ncbi:MAG: hypothetical protein Q9M17_10015, partial [Mariprofundus sp.]|nr:hypothetical protein [Mariprofundus sp.]
INGAVLWSIGNDFPATHMDVDINIFRGGNMSLSIKANQYRTSECIQKLFCHASQASHTEAQNSGGLLKWRGVCR